MHFAAITQPHFTYGDYVGWMGDERWELIDGIAHLMSPSPRRSHQRLSIRLAAQLDRFFGDGPCQVYAAPFDVRLPKGGEPDAEIDTVVQPDLVVVCDPGKLDAAGCRGAPDWVIEILSPSTQARDLVEKRDVYERAGVREYWVIDPETLTLVRHLFDPATKRFGPPVAETGDGWSPPAIFPELSIDRSRISL